MEKFDILAENREVLAHQFLEASAGTGKTFAIEHLVAKWILQGIPLREILVVTFTKAATQELIERIYKRLQQTLGSIEDPQKKLFLQAALGSYDEAKIYTIHGFCLALLQRYPLVSGCELSFSSSLFENKNTMVDLWMDFLRSHIDPKQYSPIQLKIYFGGDFEKNLLALVRRSEPSFSTLPCFADLPLLIEKKIQDLGVLPQDLVFEEFLKLEEIYTGFTGYKEQYVIVSKWCSGQKVHPEEIETIWNADSFFLTEIASAQEKKRKKEVSLRYVGFIDKLHRELGIFFAECTSKEKIADTLYASFQNYRKSLEHKSALPDELIESLFEAVQRKEFVDAVQGLFSCIVIDEFQDTDRKQWTIFSSLFLRKTATKAFYLVGDPKQSIYSFRTADLYTYLEAKQAFFSHEVGTLSVNYRSVSPLVEALNAFFYPGDRAEWMRLPKLQTVVEIPHVEPFRQEKGIEKDIGHIHLVFTKEGEKVLFSYIAEQIIAWKKRGIALSNIAILVKDRFEARRLIRVLNLAKIKTHYPLEGSLVDTLVFRAVCDLFALLEDPKDCALLKKVLLGPFFCWSLELLDHENIREISFCFYQLASLFEIRGMASFLFAFLHRCWSGKESIATILLRQGLVERYEEVELLFSLLIERCATHAHPRLYLQELAKTKYSDDKILEKRPSLDRDAVEITTIFQSKGLEYEVVFPLAIATDEKKEGDDEEAMAEKMRLLYVALTRARQCVYFPWIEGTEQSIADQFLAHVDPNLSREKIKGYFTELQKKYSITWEEIVEKRGSILEPSEQRGSPILEFHALNRMYTSRRVTSFSSMAKKDAHPEVPIQKIEGFSDDLLPSGVETGRLVHGILEHIFLHSLHNPYAKEEIREWIEKKTKETPFFAFVDSLCGLIHELLHLVITPIAQGKSLFQLSSIPSSSLLTELAFMYDEGDNLIKGFIDLIFMHEGLYYIIDWKTNTLSEYSVENMEESMRQNRYYLQAEIYQKALERYVKLFDQRPFNDCFGGTYYLYIRGMKWISLKL